MAVGGPERLLATNTLLGPGYSQKNTRIFAADVPLARHTYTGFLHLLDH